MASEKTRSAHLQQVSGSLRRQREELKEAEGERQELDRKIRENGRGGRGAAVVIGSYQNPNPGYIICSASHLHLRRDMLYVVLVVAEICSLLAPFLPLSALVSSRPLSPFLFFSLRFLFFHLPSPSLSPASVSRSLNLRLAGRLLRTPLRFFSRLSKNDGAQRRCFWHTLSYIFSAHVVEILDPGHARSGHQVTSSDLTS